MSRLEALRKREKELELAASQAEQELSEEREMALLEDQIEAKERAIAAAPCARAWRKFCDVTANSDRIRPARIAFGRGTRYAEVMFRQTTKAEIDGANGEEASKALFISCVQWYPGQPDTEAVDAKKFEAWLTPYLTIYPLLWSQLITALANHSAETTEIYRGKA